MAHQNPLKTELGDELYTASEQGDLHKVIDLSSQDHWQNSPKGRPLSSMMAVAAGKDHVEVVRYCLSEGGHISDNVMLHILTGRAFETYKFLLTSKAVDPDYRIPWYGDFLGKVAPKGDVKWTKLCLENGANPNMNKVDEFKSVLGATAESGHLDTATLLLEHGAWLHDSGAIVLAAEAGKEDMVRFLLEKGADVNEIGVEDPTDPRETEEMGSPLHKAAANGHEGVIQILLERGAKVDLKDAQGRTALQLAEAHKYRDIVNLLDGS